MSRMNRCERNERVEIANKALLEKKLEKVVGVVI